MSEETKDLELEKAVHAEVDKTIDSLNLFDDDLMSLVFDENIEATELLLRIILGRDDIEVITVKGQIEYKNPITDGRNIKLDIHAKDKAGVEFDVEVQRNTEGSNVKRARFHSSMMDQRMLKEKQKFKDILDSYVIFICQHDKFKKNLPIYHLERIITETMEPVDDGSHIIYVNGTYKGDDPIGKLVHDFNCEKADDIYYEPLANGVRHFKETEEGRDVMCEAFEKLAESRVERSKAEMVKMMMKNLKLTLEQALDAVEIKGNERAIISQMILK